MRRYYTSVSEATSDLTKRGYTENFILKPEYLESNSLQLKLHPEDFKIDEFYRFEGMSNPDDNSIVFAISSKDGVKGVLVDAYGVYSESLNEAMIQKLSINRQAQNVLDDKYNI
jgi:hypothetical protein